MSLAEADLWGGARIGLLGGTFDPPHVAHVRMAEVARETLALDRVVFTAARRPPHKPSRDTTAFEHRATMLDLAVAGRNGLVAARVEAESEPSFTVDLLRVCRSRTSADLYFIVGADNLAEIASWKEPQEIIRLCTLVVFKRAAAPAVLPVAGGAAVVVFEHPVIDVSSTEIRRRIRDGDLPCDVLDPAVAAYISSHGLYRGN